MDTLHLSLGSKQVKQYLILLLNEVFNLESIIKLTNVILESNPN